MEVDIVKLLAIGAILGIGFFAGQVRTQYLQLKNDNSRLLADIEKLKARIAELEANAKDRWTHTQQEILENLLTSLGKYQYLKDENDAIFENAKAWAKRLFEGGPNGNGKNGGNK